ncbi:MAG: gliding motility-associated lipoprotein GldH [Sphingobacteriales bacterium]|jgi:gliding motility-associated lipoprotein GldH
MRKLWVFGVLIAGLTSCGPKPLVSEFKEFEGQSWNLQDSLVCFFDVADSIAGNDFFVFVRNTEDYPYKNLFLYVDYTFPDRELSDTIALLLSDRLGRWKGSGLGGVYSNEFLFKKNIRFPSSGRYTARITHGMRDSIVPGIAEIGFEIIPLR